MKDVEVELDRLCTFAHQSDYTTVSPEGLINGLTDFFASQWFPAHKAVSRRNTAKAFAQMCDDLIRQKGLPWDTDMKARPCFNCLWRRLANVELQTRYSVSFDVFQQLKNSYTNETNKDIRQAFIQNLIQALNGDILKEINLFISKHVYDKAKATSTLRKTIALNVAYDLSKFVFPEDESRTGTENTVEFMLHVVQPAVKRNFYHEWELRYPKQKLNVLNEPSESLSSGTTNSELIFGETGELVDIMDPMSDRTCDLIARDMVEALFDSIDRACEKGSLTPENKLLLTLYYAVGGDFDQMALAIGELEGNPTLTSKNVRDRFTRLVKKLQKTLLFEDTMG